MDSNIWNNVILFFHSFPPHLTSFYLDIFVVAHPSIVNFINIPRAQLILGSICNTGQSIIRYTNST